MMNKWRLALGAVLTTIAILGAHYLIENRDNTGVNQQAEPIGNHLKLPAVRLDSPVSFESAMQHRRSVRNYADKPLFLGEVSQLLWSAQGIILKGVYRTAPSAGALYPLEVYLLVGAVDGLETGIYKYLPSGHQLLKVSSQDKRDDLYLAALKQEPIRKAPIVIVFAAVYQRTQVKYGDRAQRYVDMEVGSATQNVYLQATALDLGTAFIGAFSDEQVKTTLSLAEDEQALGLMPVGRPRARR
ncbi:SagB/ThcOx family dehydrogenase [Mycobacterium riyadhense]|uniref:Nitroreductase family protein n=1 Tax=Mycobacterium riyadhense TaxID=486698 RepID=A0A653EVQ9_9MYCO|nr:SagB/ThcOx family dehydrogenase [Mycobacterium riyadhense]VTP00846.1 Nitroreductase family protein [Mycobacterium riyadhense]